MKILKFLSVALPLICSSVVYASDIPYCPGTIVTPARNTVLQNYVQQYAKRWNLDIAANCLLGIHNVDGPNGYTKYSIAWGGPSNHTGNTFICYNATNKCTLF
jgi:hypothetical protein